MIYLMVTYKIREDRLGQANGEITKLLSTVRKQEPDTLVYQVFNPANDQSSFMHFMVFPNTEAHLAHVSARHLKQFVEALLPFCQDGPHYSELRLVDSIASLGHPLKHNPTISRTNINFSNNTTNDKKG